VSVPSLARARRADASVHSSAAASLGRSTIAATPAAARVATVGAPLGAPASAPRTGTTRVGPAKRVARTNGVAAARRKRHHLGFVLFASVVVGLLVLGLVTLNAFVAQSSFRIDHLRARVNEQAQRYQALERQAARLSAPGRIAAWADRHAMRSPEDISVLHISGLHVPGPRGASAAAGPDDLAPDGSSLKPIDEGGG
jgi:cell division protein FtsL